jgi:hypothetical protein
MGTLPAMDGGTTVSTVVMVVAGMPRLYGESGASVVGQALESYNPDANDGRGDATFTDDPLRVKRFRSMVEAADEWKRVSTIRPVRDDGKPNRPLTVFTVTFMPLKQWQERMQDKRHA